MMGRSPCCNESGLKKGPWTPEEDQKLVDYINTHGHGSWRALPQLAGLNRCGKSCRLRWTNYLRPDIKRGKFSDEEERLIINLHSALGNKWSRIATYLPGRTDNEIKNFWNTHLRKKLLQMGIDPKTHRPRTDLNFIVKLSQLFSTASFSSLMSPWDNALRLQADATQLAKIQLLQNILQVINTSSLPTIEETSLLGSHNLGQFKGLVNGANTLYSMDPSQAIMEFPSAGVTPQPPVDFNSAVANPWATFDCGLSPEVMNLNNNGLHSSCEIQTGNPLPELVSASPETSMGNEMESKMNQTFFSNPSATSNIFEVWETLMDDENSGSFWKDITD